MCLHKNRTLYNPKLLEIPTFYLILRLQSPLERESAMHKVPYNSAKPAMKTPATPSLAATSFGIAAAELLCAPFDAVV